MAQHRRGQPAVLRQRPAHGAAGLSLSRPDLQRGQPGQGQRDGVYVRPGNHPPGSVGGTRHQRRLGNVRLLHHEQHRHRLSDLRQRRAAGTRQPVLPAVQWPDDRFGGRPPDADRLRADLLAVRHRPRRVRTDRHHLRRRRRPQARLGAARARSPDPRRSPAAGRPAQRATDRRGDRAVAAGGLHRGLLVFHQSFRAAGEVRGRRGPLAAGRQLLPVRRTEPPCA